MLSGRNDAVTACQDQTGAGHVLRQRLRVAAIEKDFIRLEVDRASACSRCGVRAGCGAGALTEMIGGGRSTIRVPRTRAVRPGDEVIVAMPAGTFLGGMVLAHLLPPASLALAAACFIGLGLPDVVAAVLSLPVLALSLIPLLWAERRGRMSSKLRIEAVVTPGSHDEAKA